MIVSIKNAQLAEIGSQACVMMAQQKVSTVNTPV